MGNETVTSCVGEKKGGVKMGTATKSRMFWRQDLRRFLRHCEASGPEHQSELIREASHLFAGLREELGIPFPHLGEYELEAFLMLRAYESAVVALLGPDANYMISRGDGTCFATVVFPWQTDEQSAAGD